MTQVGCVLWSCLLFLLVCGGAIVAEARRGAGWLGMATGVVSWLAALSAYLVVASLVERRRTVPDRVADPWWALPAVGAFAVGAGVAAVALYRRTFP